MHFLDRESVIRWIGMNQNARRNLAKAIAIKAAKNKVEPKAKKQAKEQQKRKPKSAKTKVSEQTEATTTRAKVAKEAGVSEGTVSRYNQIEKEDPELLEEVLAGKETIGSAHNKVTEKKPKEPHKESAGMRHDPLWILWDSIQCLELVARHV